jgi:putative acetyltransferase
MPDITIEIASPDRPDAIALIQALDDHLKQRYPIESTHLLDVKTLMQPNITFLLAFSDGEAVGCGALRREEGYAEIKRMYVRPSQRGLGVGYKILSRLEELAIESGYATVRLETGVYQPEAIKLYERKGFVRRGPFAEYTDDPLSLCYEKQFVS